jgi:hypothetical protein
MSEIPLYLKAVRGVSYIEVAKKGEYNKANNSLGILE